ncbi:MAG: AAA family ATPase [Asticcacaulis sp.]|uniref:AAA family ATPase n=1 Tax=Asticcacaulis sp. TaxID=1872648 RepID=UPI003F7BAE5B
MANFNITIENCNSIDQATVVVTKGSLNIKYGPNGIGKSTIAKAIVCQTRNDGSLEGLTPFKNRGKAASPKPAVTGVDDIKSSLVFDEEYVSQFAFQQDEVVKNSFDIFIKTPEYEATLTEIDTLFLGIKKAFADNVDLEQTLKDLKDLRDAFGSSTADKIHKSSKIHKAFGSGNKIDNVPEVLKPYETFIKSNEPSKWIAWQIKGNEFLKLGETCPYCSNDLPEGPQKETVLAVEKEYDVKAVDHLNTLKAIIQRLGKYFSDKCRENLDKVTKAKIELTAQEQGFLTSLRTDIEALIGKLESLRSISFFSLRDVDKIKDNIEALKIDLAFIEKLDSEETRKVIDPINVQLETLIKEVGTLTGTINKHKARIAKTIKDNQESINAFLKSAGYKYQVVITAEPDSYKMKLVHQDLNKYIESAASHLSYGEKNAFALVLFMHQVLSENPDIVILDDPISSFDKNKKFAILHELFQGRASLKGRTTLMLTHDIEPAIDVIKSISRVFQGSSPTATFLSSKAGVISEVPILRDDIQTFAKICNDNMGTLADPVIKAIYMRRYYEILDDVGMEYNMLASLFKKRPVPTVKTDAGQRDMTPAEKQQAEAEIKKCIPEFDYDSLVQDVSDDAKMKAKFAATDVGYEKIQLFRILRGQHDDDVITKFINESYHIENEYVMQLNPHKFESVPEYVIEECAKIIAA